MSRDPYWRSALTAVSEYLDTHHTNTIARDHVWQAVNVALNRYEDEMTQHADVREGYAVTLAGRPVLVVHTRRQARQQRRLLRRYYPSSGYRIMPTRLAID